MDKDTKGNFNYALKKHRIFVGRMAIFEPLLKKSIDLLKEKKINGNDTIKMHIILQNFDYYYNNYCNMDNIDFKRMWNAFTLGSKQWNLDWKELMNMLKNWVKDYNEICQKYELDLCISGI